MCAGGGLGSGDKDFSRLRPAARASSRGRLATPLPACVVLVSCEAAEGSAGSSLCVHCGFSVDAYIVAMHQTLRARVPVQDFAPAMKTFEGSDKCVCAAWPTYGRRMRIASQCADATIVREVCRTHAPAKGSAPAMKTLEGSDELHGLRAEAASQRRCLHVVRACPAKLQKAPLFPVDVCVLCRIRVCRHHHHASSASHACVGEGLGSGDEDMGRLGRTARLVG